MSLFNWLFNGTPSRDVGGLFSDSHSVINPASGLPMIDGYGGVDVQGNVYGFSSDDGFSSLSDSSFCDFSSDDGFSSFSDSSFCDDSMGGFDPFDSAMDDIGGCGGFMDD